MIVVFFRFVLAKLMDRRSNAEEAVLIREELRVCAIIE